MAATFAAAPASSGALDDGIAAFQRGDFSTARAKFEPLAVNGDAVAQYYLGDLIVRYAQPQHKAQGVVWLQQSAQGGVPDAMNELARVLSEGKIVAADQAKATELFMQAASLGHLPAYNNLGLRSAQGIGRPPDPLDASEWFRLAADQGFAESQFNLAVLYANGDGVKRDLVESFKWLTLAMKQGHLLATRQRPVVAQQMTAAEIQEAEKRAVAWRPVKPKKAGT
ncbi:MAG: sel1 repeat family protein [Alphaproteobacteria bacterium]|nr:sel1 repeat family protein [Alphaproteobacteria bacterium]